MLLFVLCLSILYLLTLLRRRQSDIFIKEKTIPLKGLLAILIVIHHLSLYIDHKALYPFQCWGAPIVSLFFFVSGYGLMKSYMKNGKVYLLQFIANRVVSVLLFPFFIAYIINCIVNWGEIPNMYVAFNNLLSKGITVLPNSWFVYALLFFYLLFYVSARYLKKNMVIFISSIVIVYILILAWRGFHQHWWMTSTAFPFGLFYAKKEEWFIKKWSNDLLYYFTVPFSLFIVAICAMIGIKLIYTLAYIMLPFAIVCLLSKINIERLSKVRVMSFLASISYEIYLCHGIWILFLYGKVKSNVLFIIIIYSLTIVLAYTIHKVENPLLKLCGLKSNSG